MKYKVATITPIWQKSLGAQESTSIRHLMTYLPGCEHVAICPRGLGFADRRFRVVEFAADYFRSTLTYNRLMTSREFYQAFRHFDYVLIYHLDALVFADEIEKWCQAEYSYIGAPLWINETINDVILSMPEKVTASTLADLAQYQIGILVGNGGFSLRKVQDHLETLESGRFFESADAYYRRKHSQQGLSQRALGQVTRVLKAMGYKNTVTWFINNFGGNEDRFWAENARIFNPAFRVAPPEVALEFAFEVAPTLCYEMNRRRLPFGCHAWAKYDRAFWAPYLIQD